MAVLMRNDVDLRCYWDTWDTSPRLGFLEEKLRIELYNRSGVVQSGVMWSVFCLPVVERRYLQLY